MVGVMRVRTMGVVCGECVAGGGAARNSTVGVESSRNANGVLGSTENRIQSGAVAGRSRRGGAAEAAHWPVWRVFFDNGY